MGDLSDLPNIGAKLAVKLQAAGINDRETLAKIGSVEAIVRIGAADGSGCTNMLCALEGAIRGIRWHDLPTTVREELKRKLTEARR